MPLNAPIQMPTLRIELDGVKQAMLVAIRDSSNELVATIQHQLTACLAQVTPESIMIRVTKALDDAVREAVAEAVPELIEEAIDQYFKTGEGSSLVIDALKARFGRK